MHVPGGRAVGDDRDGLVGRMGRIVFDLHVQNGGQPAKPLGPDAERVHLFVQLQTKLL